MPYYEYECEVTGVHDGVIDAKNKKQALEHVEGVLMCEGLEPVGNIKIKRVKKPEWWIEED